MITHCLLIAPAGVEKVTSPTQRGLFAFIKKLFQIPGLRHIGEQIKKHRGSADYNALDGIMKEIFVKVVNQDLTPLFAQITVPVQIFRGDADTQIERRQIMQMREHIPGVLIHATRHGTHDLHYEIVEEIFKYLDIMADEVV